MTLIVWTIQAVEDVEAIRSFIARNSVRYAALVVEQIVDAVDRLEHFPRSGRVVPELQDETIREVILSSYRIVYRVTADVVQILTVFHASRQFGLREGS